MRTVHKTGGMVEATETPSEAAAREIGEEVGLHVPIGRLLVVDSLPARLTRHGRALTAHVFDAPVLNAAQARSLVFADGEVRAARWLAPKDAIAQLPTVLGNRIEAAFRALRHGDVEVLDHTATASLDDPERGDGR
ncbi:NUDIX hydrolase [Streptomyces sp. BE20]|uniref:NUDIX hydrolase n=1 Tax=Streptomyces sp. BE20 TaxID=3002525 RepID=UPI002E76532A|nr:NUDIX hydrolase [Streptomyces sp. BE20]MEE1823793.1 NUDIX hydrolase [Streptomyces sp. BE20]